MKTLTLLFVGILVSCILPAQNESPIPKLNQQLANYFSYYPKEKVFVMTDKTRYKSGEILWFNAFASNGNSTFSPEESRELFVKLYDSKGKQVLQEIFRLKNGSVHGDLIIPDDLPKGYYFLSAQTSLLIPNIEISYTPLIIDPAYSNQWVATVMLKDSISISGQKNELNLFLADVSGGIQKNTSLRYQVTNGTEIIEKGKLKTDEKGRASLSYTIPEKTNGEPFVCVLSDSRDDWKYEVFLPSDLDPLVVRFYPEGGNLIAGIPSKIGFTVFNKWGIPVDLEGSVFDQNGKSVAMVKTFTEGLGLFPLVNDGQQKYKLILSGKTGQNQSFELPAPKSDGLALAITKTDIDFISAILIFADKKKHAVALTVTQGSGLYWAADMDIDGIGRIKIPKENLQQGINLLSAFSKEGKLLAERIVFIDKNQRLNVEVVPEKTMLKSNESTKIKVRLTDENNQPVAGNITVAVTDKMRGGVDKQQIDKYLQISSELETPFSLISEAYNGKVRNPVLMDMFLIANRIKGFSWEKILNFKPELADESNMGKTGISGIVTDKSGNRINRAKVILLNGRNIQLHSTTTNSEGVFAFPNLNTIQPDAISVKATDQEGKRELKVVVNKSSEDQVADFIAGSTLQLNLFNTERVANEVYFKNNPDLFSKAPKPVKPNTTSLDFQRKLLSNATNLMDVIKTLKPYQVMNNQIVFIGSENSLNFQGGALLVLDGQQLGTDISVIQNISPFEVDHINVSTSPIDIQRYTGLNSVGVIEIFQKKARIPELFITEETTGKYEDGFRIPRVFPSATSNSKLNTQTTLFWIPEQEVDQSGQFEFSVTAGKILSDFVIKVQGISVNGLSGSGSAGFSVSR